MNPRSDFFFLSLLIKKKKKKTHNKPDGSRSLPDSLSPLFRLPNKSFNYKEITFLEMGILFGYMCRPKLPLWAGMWVRRLQAAERRPAGAGQAGPCIIVRPELSIANCSPHARLADHHCRSPISPQTRKLHLSWCSPGVTSPPGRGPFTSAG